jgi:hypothetical protein
VVGGGIQITTTVCGQHLLPFLAVANTAWPHATGHIFLKSKKMQYFVFTTKQRDQAISQWSAQQPKANTNAVERLFSSKYVSQSDMLRPDKTYCGHRYYLFTKQQLDYAIKGWITEEQPLATQRSRNNHPDVAAVRQFFASPYIQESGIARGRSLPEV